MKKSLLLKINKTLELLTAPATAIVAVWTTDVKVSAIVAGSLGLLMSVVSYLELFAKDE